MGLFEAIRRAFTLPASANSLSDVARNPVGALGNLAGNVLAVGGVASGVGLPFRVPGWVHRVSALGSLVSSLNAAREHERMANAALVAMQQGATRLGDLVLALQMMSPPLPLAPRVEQMMRANLQMALQSAERSAPAGVDMSGVLGLMRLRGLAQMADVYNQQLLRDQEVARQDMLRRLQMMGGLYGDVFQMQQGMHGLAMSRQQILQQGVANALQVFSQLMGQAGQLSLQRSMLETAGQAGLMGAGAALMATGMPALGGTLWNMARRK